MATEKAQNELRDLEQWKEDGVGDWLDKEGYHQYRASFAANHITGEVLPMLQKDDLKKLGVDSVGHRVQLLASLADLKAARAIANRTDKLLRFQHYRMGPHPFSTKRYTLTPSAIEVENDRSLCGITKQAIDIGSITDVQLVNEGCLTGCFWHTVVIYTDDPIPHKIDIKSAQATQVHKTIRRTWEGFQAARTGQMRHIGGF
jgi:hypothetical protein